MLLSLPMCPVYGIGGAVLTYFMSAFRDDWLLTFAFGAILASAVELLYYLLAVELFKIRVWDYRNKKANFAGGICGEYTILWGLLAVVFVRFVDPAVDAAIGTLSSYEQLLAAIFLSIITAADMRNTVQLLYEYKKGSAELPACFWYMSRV